MSWGQIISFEIPFTVMGGQWSIWEALAEKTAQNSLGNSVRHLCGYLAATFAGTFAGTLLREREKCIAQAGGGAGLHIGIAPELPISASA